MTLDVNERDGFRFGTREKEARGLGKYFAVVRYPALVTVTSDHYLRKKNPLLRVSARTHDGCERGNSNEFDKFSFGDACD